jgi:hypothetical protein
MGSFMAPLFLGRRAEYNRLFSQVRDPDSCVAYYVGFDRRSEAIVYFNDVNRVPADA